MGRKRATLADGTPAVTPLERGQAFRARRLEARRAGRLMAAPEAADYLGIPYSTLRRLAQLGAIPVVRPPGSDRMWFDRADLDRAVLAWKARLS